MKLSHFLTVVSFVSLILLLPAKPISAQDDTLLLRLNRDFGYSSGTGDIQGRFSLRASGPVTLNSVTFFMDGEPMGTVTESPYRLQFETDNYPLGEHTMSAVGTTTDGQTLESGTITRNFVAAGEGLQAAGRIIGITVVVLVVVLGIGSLILWFVSRNKPPLPMGAPRQYGHYGGTICPNCQRPYSMHIYGLNLFTHRFDRCPHCGKWRLVRRASPEALELAEKAEIGQVEASPDAIALTEEEHLRRRLEDSRFDDV